MNASSPHLVVVGSGFAGVWAALAAATCRQETKTSATITVVSPTPTLEIRPRFYEDDLARSSVELAHLFAPVDVRHLRAVVTDLDPRTRRIQTDTGPLAYDALVLAAGSAMVRPKVSGTEHVFSVDTRHGAAALRAHLAALPDEPGAETLTVVGAGFTGIEVATELVATMRARFGAKARVILVERAPTIAPDFGPRARAVIGEALGSLGIEARPSTCVESVSPSAAMLEGGERLATHTVVWCAGLRASPLGISLGRPVDDLGRVTVDEELRAVDAVWVAGDAARVRVDAEHTAPMSCQHAMPQGRFAGYNAMRWLAGKAPTPYAQRLYFTCLDLGAWGALLTKDFARDDVLCVGAEAKAMKGFINRSAIYPPLDGNAASLLEAARPHAEGPLRAAVLGALVQFRFVRSASISGHADGPAALDRARGATPT